MDEKNYNPVEDEMIYPDEGEEDEYEQADDCN